MSHSGNSDHAEGRNGQPGSSPVKVDLSRENEHVSDPDARLPRTLGECEDKRAARAIQQRMQDLQRERHRLTDLLGKALELLERMDGGVRALRNSVSLQLGYLLVRSFRSWRDMLALPLRVFRLARDGHRGRVVEVPLPHEWFPPELHQELDSVRLELAETDGMQSASGGHRGGQRRASRYGLLPDKLGEVRIATVMDEFTFKAYSECCEVLQLTPDGWLDEMQGFAPHLLFIESAWEGKDAAWLRKISGASTELRLLAAHCRKLGIPVVFWNKEDPVHFTTFLDAARLADVVFTTDIDCIAHYKAELGHERAFLLPFATQPIAHNPIERYERDPGFCFAGSYYTRYPVRQRDFASLITAVTELGKVDIFDRNHGKDHPNYMFPEDYRRHIVGHLPYDKIDLAYKGYDFGININTVKNSQSMFARRVFDLLASNTVVVSNYSKGMRLMFGDLVVSSDDWRQLTRRLAPLVEDIVARRKHRLLGLRKVMSEHTYQHRLSYMLGKVFAGAPVHVGAQVVMLARVSCEEDLEQVLRSFHRQLWRNKRLTLCFSPGFSRERSPVAENVRVLSEEQAAKRQVSQEGGGGYVGCIHPADYHGPNYITDLALATGYCGASTIGKGTYYEVRGGIPVPALEGQQYRPGAPIARRRGITLAASIVGTTVKDWLDGVESCMEGGFAIDEFNYCEGGAALQSTGILDDLQDVYKGEPIAGLLSLSERVHRDESASARTNRDESAGMPGLDAHRLFQLIGTPENKHLSTSLQGNELVVDAALPPGGKAYAHLAGTFTPAELRCTDIARMQLVTRGSAGLWLLLVYLDAHGQKISHSILKSDASITVGLPPTTHAIQVGLRATKSGSFRIRRLVFDHVPLSVDTLVPRAKRLLLAKNYPSYSDLYKHAFVHRRALAYRRRGVEVEVFRISSAGLSFYEFEGVDVTFGQLDHLRAMLRSGEYTEVLVHVMDWRMWEVLEEFVDQIRFFVWAHGSEMQSASRRDFEHAEHERSRAVALGEQRMRFWRRIFSEAHPNLKMVFVSQWAARDIMDDVGVVLDPNRYAVIHNFIDCDLFTYRPKRAAQRKKILSIRPYASNVYANDLSVAAILELSRKPYFVDLEFRMVGDGALFEATVEPLRSFKNVIIEQRFLPQEEIATLHKEYGVFLVPTRMDSQGVSRDEAMASGLVPVTNSVAAIPEFVDDTCGVVVGPEDAKGLAAAIERLYFDEELFLRLSAAAAERVRRQSSAGETIDQEIALFATRAEGEHGREVR